MHQANCISMGKRLVLYTLLIGGSVIINDFDLSTTGHSPLQRFALDSLGYHQAYTVEYLSLMQIRIRRDSCFVVKVAEKELVTIKRPSTNQISLAIQKRRSPPAIIVDGRVWNILRCQQRLRTNERDGDARVLLGCYFQLIRDYENALQYLKVLSSVYYALFTTAEIIELRGRCFYELGQQALKKRQLDSWIMYIEKEQAEYLNAIDKLTGDDNFMYLYSLTFIDIGLTLEKIEASGGRKPIILADSIRVNIAADAYNRALDVLLAINKPDVNIREKRIMVYTRLGKTMEAEEERKILGRAVKLSIYEKERAPIRTEILDGLKDSIIVKTDFLEYYIQRLERLYTDTSDTVKDDLDSLCDDYCNFITIQLLDKNASATVLSETNWKLLYDEIGFEIRLKLGDTLRTVQKDHLWKLLFFDIREKRYKKALSLIDTYGILLAENNKKDELAMLRTSVEEAMTGELRKSARKAASAQAADSGDTTLSRSEGGYSYLLSRAKRNSEVTGAGNDQMYVRVGRLIDVLITNNDFIGAYRGARVYEKILKEKYGNDKIDSVKTDLEKIILRDYGKKYLKKLRKELSE